MEEFSKDWKALPVWLRIGIGILGTTTLLGIGVWQIPVARSFVLEKVDRVWAFFQLEKEVRVGDIPVSPSADPLAELRERQGELSTRLDGYEKELKASQDSVNILQQRLKDAVAEVIKTNDLLAKEQADWQKTMAAFQQSTAVVAESPSGGVSRESGGKLASGKINLNTANLAELDSLPGIGPSYAQRIIDYRQQQGAFKSVDDLLEVQGIGPALLEKVKDQVEV